jgi:hypothetical protein
MSEGGLQMKTPLNIFWRRFLIGLGFFLSALTATHVFLPGDAGATMIFVSDMEGHVGKYDTVTGVASPLGSLASAFTVGQAVGLAYNPATNSVLVLDRYPQFASRNYTHDQGTTVYSMSAQTGATSLLFHTGVEGLQGGAVKGSSLYVTVENYDVWTNTMGAIPVTGGTDLSVNGAQILPGHAHAMGINPATGQLYSSDMYVGSPNDPNLPSEIFKVNDNGTRGGVVVTLALSTLYLEDIDYYNGNFLGAVTGHDGGAYGVYLIDSTTGAATLFLTADQITAMGLTHNLEGVTVATPLPAALWLFAPALVGLAGLRRRFKV